MTNPVIIHKGQVSAKKADEVLKQALDLAIRYQNSELIVITCTAEVPGTLYFVCAKKTLANIPADVELDTLETCVKEAAFVYDYWALNNGKNPSIRALKGTLPVENQRGWEKYEGQINLL